ncbi:polyprenol monophosphomannose synthase [Moheibacter sediminis]|uniref:Dolichol-phosphate mannosyltransferase n=1 Tax=Moheibacter sediminis TaxID=1434700 RepID=A0A1W2C8K6_9FLAO|nr:polyprenol monophosphomannose synthase [Moheibacter sediminis]SMC81513.1 dolichol-phosphate mannosyltransferase [Moheibacter sediminis]
MSERLVIIPTYNELENVENIIRKVFALPADFHILIVDDSSPDGTGFIVRELQKEFPKLFLETRIEKDGLGKAYTHGFKWALDRSYQYIFEMDADLSHNPEDLPKLLQALENGNDVSVGSRYSHGVNVVNWPMTRVLLSFIASKYARFVTGLPVNDATAGFVGYKRIVLEKLDLNRIKFKGYGFQIEMKYKSWKKGFKIIEVPIIFTNRVAGESKISANIMGEAVFGILMLRIRSIFGTL